MIKKMFVGVVLFALISSCFAGYSSGGRSGFSAGSRSYSSASAGRSGYSRSTNITTRSYVQPRSYSTARTYSGASNSTVIHNNHYSHGGGGIGVGGGFLSGMLGGYLGGSLANNHHTTVVAGGSPVVAQGQGMLMEGSPAILPQQNTASGMIGSIIAIMFAGLIIWLIVVITKSILGDKKNRW